MFEIYLKDLKPETQKELLEWIKSEDCLDKNLEVYPIYVHMIF